MAGPQDDGGSGLDLAGLIGATPPPFVIWAVTTAGGLALFAFMVRRTESDDMSLDRLAAFPATAPEATVVVAVDAGRVAPVTGRATMLPPAQPRAFDKAAAKGVERAKIGYRRVRISSKPDAIRSVERGRLDRGDEVEILDSYEGFLEIRTPDGITGWILRHTIVGGSTV